MAMKEGISGFPLPRESSKIFPEISLEAEIERQAKRYLELGYHRHKEIRMSNGKFKDWLMKLVAPQPENFQIRLNTPVAVFGQVPIKDQCALAGIKYFLEGYDARDWPEDPQQYETPNSLYLAWTDEGARFMKIGVRDVRRELAVDERGGTKFDGVGLYIVKPQVLQKRFLDLPGTAVGSDRAPYLDLWDVRPALNGHFVGLAYPGFGSLVCGR